jgi:hypothetical protein
MASATFEKNQFAAPQQYENPPPPYASTQSIPQQKQPLATNNGAPPPDLYVFSEGGVFTKHKVHVMPQDRSSSLYTATYHNFSNPDIEVTRGEGGEVIGSAKFSKMYSSVAVTLNQSGNQQFKMKRPQPFSRQRDFELWGHKMSFKATSESSKHSFDKNMKLVDLADPENSIMLFHQPSLMTRKKDGMTAMGHIEFIKGGMTQEMIDAIVLATLADIEKTRRETNAAVGATAGATAGGAAAAG